MQLIATSSSRRWFCLLGLWVLGATLVHAGDPVAVRVENFTVPPATGPLAYVSVKNLLDKPYVGVLAISAPEGWQMAPAQREIHIEPGQVIRTAFAVEKARTTAANSYAFEATATSDGSTVVHRREVVVTSAPYFKPTIDGDPADWQDAIPVGFVTAGKKTVVSTYWNRRGFSLLVAVEEDRLCGDATAAQDGAVDAVQFALAPADAKTPTSRAGEVQRYEFLLVAGSGADKAACYQLAAPGTPVSETQQDRPLAGMRYEDATVAIGRSEGVTYYECSLPLKPMREQIRPSEGREFGFGVLVHDPDGTGLRDMGQIAGLWSWERTPLAWSRWPGADWPEQPPLDGKLRWGMCSSKY
jgi:hypothetical protein